MNTTDLKDDDKRIEDVCNKLKARYKACIELYNKKDGDTETSTGSYLPDQYWAELAHIAQVYSALSQAKYQKQKLGYTVLGIKIAAFTVLINICFTLILKYFGV